MTASRRHGGKSSGWTSSSRRSRKTSAATSRRSACASRPRPRRRARRYASQKITVGYFAQHQMEELPPDTTPFQHMMDLMPEGTEAQRRARLGTLGFSIGKADTRAENLSGGEKARLLLALATFHGAHL